MKNGIGEPIPFWNCRCVCGCGTLIPSTELACDRCYEPDHNLNCDDCGCPIWDHTFYHCGDPGCCIGCRKHNCGRTQDEIRNQND